MVKAFDGCSQINYSPVQRFTTEKDCQPFVITESDFVDGTLSNLDNESIPGTLILDRQWTARWRATDGTLPKDSTPKWTHDAPSGGTYELVNDPKTGKPTLQQAANDINADNREVMEGLPIINATGSAFMIRARIERADGTDGFACAVEHYDGTKKVRLGIDETKLVETMGTNQQFIMDTTTSPHSYLVGLKGNAYEIFVDNSFAMDQGIKSVASDSNLRTRWGDTSESPEIECDMYVSAFYYYVNGNKVPYFDQGKYESKVYDLSSNNVNFAGEGANLSFNSTTPYATQVIFSTRTGDSEIPDGTWSNWEIAIQGLVQSPAARFLQIQAQIKSTDSNVSPTISDFSLSGCTYLPN
jgi:hypothetical protein